MRERKKSARQTAFIGEQITVGLQLHAKSSKL